MSDLEKLNRLRHILCLQYEMSNRRNSTRAARTDSASLQISASGGRSFYLEYSGDPSRNDRDYKAPTRQYRGHDDTPDYRCSRDLAASELNDFLNALHVPELRDEFVTAVAKIARKASHIKHAASQVESAKNSDGVGVTRIKERLAGNALFELEVSDYSQTDDERRALVREAHEICDELRLREKFGYSEEHRTLPSYHEINKLYHETKKGAPLEPN